ncbi:MAG: dTMP kinase [Sphingomonadales bacterium]|nr:dTMP kinase [Sphingomonadales bacterium]
MTKGRFLSVEGGEGVGKSTQIIALAQAIRAHGHDVIITREPGGTEGAEAIRSLLLGGSDNRWQPRAEALLFAAARSDHVEHLIKPAIDGGKWVISDRFLESSRAYQGGGSGLSDANILDLHAIGSGGFLPDRTLILELDEVEASRRAELRDGGVADRIGGRDSDFHAMVHSAFRRFAAEDPARIKMIDAGGEPQAVTKRLIAAISDLL